MSCARHQISKATTYLTLPLCCLVPTACKSQVKPENQQIEWLVAQAKEQGKSTINLGQMRIMLPNLNSLDQVSGGTRIVVGFPIDSVTTMDTQGNNLETWTKFQVIQDITRTPVHHASDEHKEFKDIPAALLPVGNDQVVIEELGGTLIVDGIKVIAEAGPYFKAGRNYLLFFDPTNIHGAMNVGGLMVVHRTAFLIQADGDHFDPIYPDDIGLQMELQSKYHSSITEIKSHVAEAK